MKNLQNFVNDSEKLLEIQLKYSRKFLINHHNFLTYKIKGMIQSLKVLNLNKLKYKKHNRHNVKRKKVLNTNMIRFQIFRNKNILKKNY